MKRSTFEQLRQPSWNRLAALLDALPQARRKTRGLAREELPQLYRQVCQDLALARRRRYGAELVERLNGLALRGREALYRRPVRASARIGEYFAATFPRRVRAQRGSLWAALAMFGGTLLVCGLVTWRAPESVYSVLDPEQVRAYEEMYDPLEQAAREHSGGGAVAAFGFYVWNNVSIAFRTFAGGILFGAGSAFYLLFNGIHIGTVLAHLGAQGYASTIFPFVIGHGAFELTAIVLSGQAGLMLGWSLLAPGRLPRSRALREAGTRSLEIVWGAAAMLLLAAFIEGFWSPSSAPSEVKYAVGLCLWLGVLAYFCFAGRRRGS